MLCIPVYCISPQHPDLFDVSSSVVNFPFWSCGGVANHYFESSNAVFNYDMILYTIPQFLPWEF